MTQRPSKELVRFFGAQLSARLFEGRLANVFQAGIGTERAPGAAGVRLTSRNLVPSSLDTNAYEVAVAYLSQTSASPNTIPAMALAFVDVSKRLGVNISELVSASDDGTIQLLERRSYQFLNQLRDKTSALGRSGAVDNSMSLIGPRLGAYDPSRVPEIFMWQLACLDAVGVDQSQAQRVSFNRDEKLFATNDNGTIVVYGTADWQPVQTLSFGDGTAPLSTLSFHPAADLLLIGTQTGVAADDLQVINTLNWAPVTGSPSLASVSWAGWSPDGNRLAVVNSTDPSSGLGQLTIYDRASWNVIYQSTNTPFRPISGAWSPDGSRFSLYGNDGNIPRLAVLDTSDWSVTRQLNTPGGTPTFGARGPRMTFTSDGRQVIVPLNSEFQTAGVFVYNHVMNTSQLVSVDMDVAISAALDHTGRYAYITGRNNNQGDVVAIVDTANMTQINGLKFDGVSRIAEAVFSKTGRWLALAVLTADDPIPVVYTSCGVEQEWPHPVQLTPVPPPETS